jgi:hypothetical protein
MQLRGNLVYYRHDTGLYAVQAESPKRNWLTATSSPFTVDDQGAIYYVSGESLMRLQGTSAVPLASLQGGAVRSLATDGNAVFYTDAKRASVVRVGRHDVRERVIADRLDDWPESLALDDESVYFTTRFGHLLSRSKSGDGPLRRINPDGMRKPMGLVRDGRRTFVIDCDWKATERARVWSLPAQGAAAKIVAGPFDSCDPTLTVDARGLAIADGLALSLYSF